MNTTKPGTAHIVMLAQNEVILTTCPVADADTWPKWIGTDTVIGMCWVWTDLTEDLGAILCQRVEVRLNDITAALREGHTFGARTSIDDLWETVNAEMRLDVLTWLLWQGSAA